MAAPRGSDRTFGPARGVEYGGSSRTAAAHGLAQFVAAVAIFALSARSRVLDADEGHFLSAVQNVLDGRVPCRDFFYQQTPLFPYAYALAMWLFGHGYDACLWTSLLFGGLLAAVTARWFAERLGGPWHGWIGWMLVVANAPVLFWTPTVKNHVMPLACGMLALWAASHRPTACASAAGWGILAGFGAMAAVGSRLPALPMAAAACGWIAVRLARPTDRRAAAWGLAGFAAGAAGPALLVLRSAWPDPWVLYFDVVGFHALRSRSSTSTWPERWQQLGQLARQVQFPAAAAVAVAAAVAATWRHGLRAWWARDVDNGSAWRPADGWLLLVAVASTAASLMPAPPFHQYFMVPMLLLVVAGLPFWNFLATRTVPALPEARVTLASESRALPKPRPSGPAQPQAPPRGRAGRTAAAGLVLLLSGYASMCRNHREQLFPASWSLSAVSAAADVLRRATEPNDLVFTAWQGFSFLAGRREYPGNENFNSRTVAGKLTEHERRRLKVPSHDELRRAVVERGEPRAVALGFFDLAYYRYVLYARDAGTGRWRLDPAFQRRYRLVFSAGPNQVWVRR